MNRLLRIIPALLITLSLHLFFLPTIFAQSIRIISTKDGLPQSFVSGLEQDEQGFIWIGTRNGLVRYDGTQFLSFQHDIHNTSSVASSIVTWLRKDQSGNIWIEYETGEIDVINPATQKIQHVLSNQSKKPLPAFIRRGWIFDSKGFFWSIKMNDGLTVFDTAKKQFQQLSSKNASLPGDTCNGLLETRNGEILVVSPGAISLYNRQKNSFTNFSIPSRLEFSNIYSTDDQVIDVHERSNGEIMWGDARKLFFFNPKTKTFRTVDLPEYFMYGVKWIRNGPNGEEYIEAMSKIYEYTDAKGLVLNSKVPMSDPSYARSFLIDKSGLIWVGSNAEGIYQINSNNPFFQSFTYKKDFGPDVLSQEFGLSLERDFGWTNINQNFSASGYHLRSFYDDKQQLWIALKEMVWYKKNTAGAWKVLPRVPYLTDNYAILTTQQTGAIPIEGICAGPGGTILVSGYLGNIVQYNFETNNWTEYIKAEALRPLVGKNPGEPQDLYADNSKIWMTYSNAGLLSIDIQTKKVIRLAEGTAAGSLPTNQLLGMQPDPTRSNILWIGSYQGLIELDKNTLQCKTYSVTEGLPDNTIYSIQTDRKNNLWLSTNKGLCRFNPLKHDIRVFQTASGLPGDEFNRFHHLKLPDGELIFGGTDGWVKFDPSSFKDDNFKPRVILTGLKVNYAKALQDSTAYLSKPFNLLDTLQLNYKQNTITFQFSALQFNQPQDNLYRYKLEGYDKDWVYARNAHEANYTQLPAGHYTFYINASNTTGEWSPHVKKMAVIITPPWWAGTIAYLCYMLIIAGLTWGFIRYRIAQGIMKREMTLKENEAQQMKELAEMKTRFFSNITHEFRTPLTLIIGPAEQLKGSNVEPARQKQFADTIIRNAKQLLVLVNRLLDLSKLEAKALKIYEQKGNPAAVVGTIVHSFQFHAKTNEVTLSFTNHTGGLNGWFYVDALERIVYNLVSNALKFTPAGGSVFVELAHKDNTIILTIKDTGIGIHKSELPHIFERYHQGDKPTGLSANEIKAGTGLGLSLVKELADLQKGSIEVVSSTGDMQPPGTNITVTLPFREEITNAAMETEEEVLQTATDADEDNLKHPLVLLVEDNADVTEFLKTALSNDYQVQTAPNGKAGLDAALAIMPDIIVSDVLMPEMDGLTFCSHIKNDERTSHIPLILLTAKASHDNLMEGLSKGADDYLTKPFHPSEFLLRIRNLLARQKKLRDKLKAGMTIPGEKVQAEPETVEQDPFIEKLYGIIEEHLDDPLFGVDQLVDMITISRTSLHRKLKAVTGFSASEFIRLYRLKRATAFLRQGFNGTDTAYKSGFGSAAYFTKCFRETYGITPGEYAREANN